MIDDSSRLLTIIIPTYNRKESLSKGLSALVTQVKECMDQVSIYVSDNCSDDGTAAVVRRFQEKYPGMIGYKHQTENLGAQGNFKDAVESVSSKYVIIFSDDDVVLPGFVEKILAQLKEHPDISLINYNGLNIAPSGSFLGLRDSMCNNGEIKYYARGGDFIKEHTHCPSLVSSNVILRKAFAKQISTVNGENYPGYGWFASMLWSIIDSPCLYIDIPMFLVNCPAHQRWEHNAPWYYVVGLSRLFMDLDKKHDGIWKSWQVEFCTSWIQNRCLSLIAANQSEYKSRYAQLMENSPSEEFASKLKYYVYYPAWYRYVKFRIVPEMVKNAKRLFRV